MMRWMFAFAFCALSIVALAENKPPTTAPAAPTTKPAAPAIANTKCPVSGDAVDAKVKTVVYQGKTIGFCYADCINAFNKDPDKYVAKMK